MIVASDRSTPSTTGRWRPADSTVRAGSAVMPTGQRMGQGGTRQRSRSGGLDTITHAGRLRREPGTRGCTRADGGTCGSALGTAPGFAHAPLFIAGIRRLHVGASSKTGDAERVARAPTAPLPCPDPPRTRLLPDLVTDGFRQGRLRVCMNHAASPSCGRISRELGLPAATVRGWLRRLRSRAEEMRQHAMLQLGFIGGSDPALPVPSGSPLGDALSAVAACAHAAITSYGLSRADLWPLLGRFGLARCLAPAPGS